MSGINSENSKARELKSFTETEPEPVFTGKVHLQLIILLIKRRRNKC